MNSQETPSGAVRIAPAPISVQVQLEDRTAKLPPPDQLSDEDGAPLDMSTSESLQFGYNFLLSHTDVFLRKILRIWRRKVGGTKTERVARAFLYFRLCVRGGKEAADVFSQVEGAGRPSFKNFSSWVRDKRVAIDALKPVPLDGELMATFRPAEKDHWRECEAEAEGRRQMVEDGELPQGDSDVGGDTGYGGIGNGNGTADFTMSMFARLCLILPDDDQARLAHAGTGQTLTKEQQQNRVSREDYWQTVAERFNDASVTPHAGMRGHWLAKLTLLWLLQSPCWAES